VSKSNKITILLVDDCHDTRILSKWFFDALGYQVVSASSAEQALLLFDSQIHDVVLTDNSMPWMTGAEMSKIIKERSPETPVVMHTGNPPDKLSCIDVMICKPTNLLEVEQRLRKVLNVRKPVN
jgi:DNA-binding NtrC family response regulator